MYEYLDKFWKKELEKELESVNQSIRNYANLLIRVMNEKELEKFKEQLELEIELKRIIIKKIKESK